MDFKFLGYEFDKEEATAVFRYQGKDGIVFSEKAVFSKEGMIDYDEKELDDALFFAFVVLGTSYYKVAPTKKVVLNRDITRGQAEFFNLIYQEGMSQFAFENNLKRDDLADFTSYIDDLAIEPKDNKKIDDLILALISGGKDSLLLAEILKEEKANFRVLYIAGANGSYPDVIRDFGEPMVIRRFIDKERLKKANGLNGHVPITLINEALALIQAVLIGADKIELGIGREGLEPHTWIDDLPVNHQWSKTEEAQNMLKKYVNTFIDSNLSIGSVLDDLTELEIAKEFAEKCWDKYGHRFSSCNLANYKQGVENKQLKWCGECAKCANSYLLFAPFVPFDEQKELFGRDLFSDSRLTDIFKGLLGVDGVMKPFECVASIEELRWAYHNRLPGYSKLPFDA